MTCRGESQDGGRPREHIRVPVDCLVTTTGDAASIIDILRGGLSRTMMMVIGKCGEDRRVSERRMIVFIVLVGGCQADQIRPQIVFQTPAWASAPLVDTNADQSSGNDLPGNTENGCDRWMGQGVVDPLGLSQSVGSQSTGIRPSTQNEFLGSVGEATYSWFGRRRVSGWRLFWDVHGDVPILGYCPLSDWPLSPLFPS